MIPGTPDNLGPPYEKLPILFPYHSHIFRDSYGSGSGMGIVWGPILLMEEILHHQE